MAARPHTGVIAFFITKVFRGQKNAEGGQNSTERREELDTLLEPLHPPLTETVTNLETPPATALAPTVSEKIEGVLNSATSGLEKLNKKLETFNVTLAAKSAYYGEKSFVETMMELSELALKLQNDPELAKAYEEIQAKYDDDADESARPVNAKPEERELASYNLPKKYKDAENIDKLEMKIAVVVDNHLNFLRETKLRLDRDPDLMAIFETKIQENDGRKILAFLNAAYPKETVETPAVKRAPEPTEKLFVPAKEAIKSDSHKARVIYPPLASHAKLRQKMTAGEQKVLELFDRELTPDWEIYIQPHLNGLRPDFVLLNPNVGIAVFEVKDWNLNAMRYFTKKDQWGYDALWAKKDGKEFCIQGQNPVTKVDLYKKEVFELYCPRLKAGAGFAAITAGVVFPFAGKKQVRELLEPFLNDGQWARYRPISGAEDISTGNLGAVFPEANRKKSYVMSEDLAKDLRGWLVEPDFATTQRSPLVLDRSQRGLAETRTANGYRRIKGPAGSGKSLVLAARAASLANDGKSVLVATYNITLWHYLRDLIVRDLDAPEKIRNIEFRNFHSWCKIACINVGWEKRYDKLWKMGSQEDVLNNRLPKLTEEAVMQSGAPRYDAILVDEGQDYLPLWWNVLRKVCKPDGEMLLVADATQDVYGTAKSWTDDVMKGAGFSGGWAQLSTSYRLPPDAMNFARNFAETFLPKGTIDLPQPDQETLDFYPCNLRWVQCELENGEKACTAEILSLMRQTGKAALANADITFLTGDMDSGQRVVNRLAKENIQTVDAFGEDHRRKKMGFYMGDARIKATTLHSFKGWETRLLVIYVADAAHVESLALVYAGLTRLKRSQEGSWLTVVCSSPALGEYGNTWPKE